MSRGAKASNAGNVKRDRKAARARRRADLTRGYRTSCREEIALLRQQKASTDEFRAALKSLRHRFTRAIAGRQ
jgi:hypothetical protein